MGQQVSVFSRFKDLVTKGESISAKVKPYQFAAKIAASLNESFNDFVVVLLESFREDFDIDRSAFFLIEKGAWKLKAKIGENLPDYDKSPADDEMIDVKSVHTNIYARPAEGIGFDLYVIIRDEKQRAIGVLAMDDTGYSRKFNDEELSTFELLAETFNQLLRQKNRFDDLTVKDPLTGLFNRHIYKDIEKDFSNVTCVWQLDIDHFKRINDEFGHPAGDAVLKHLAKFLKQRLRTDDDIVIRNGGEEIVIVMKRLKPKLGLMRVKHLSEAFSKEEIEAPDGIILRNITFSVGFYATRRKQDFSKSMKEADKLLYQAKEQGRNKVVFDLDL